MTQTGECYQRDRTLHPPAYTPNYKTSVTRSPSFNFTTKSRQAA